MGKRVVYFFGADGGQVHARYMLRHFSMKGLRVGTAGFGVLTL